MVAKELDVIVVGAGIGGIAAASELAKNGLKVVVLEARDRLGGRLFTDRKSGSKPYELGCSWLHESVDNPLLKIALDNDIKVTYDDGSIAFYDKNGPLDGSKELGPAASDFNAFASIYFADHSEDISYGELINLFIKQHPTLTQVQKEEVPALLEFPQVGKGLESSQLSGKLAFNGGGKGRDLAVPGGYDAIYNAIKKPIGDENIILNSPVESVETDNEKGTVRVHTAGGDVYTAKYAIITAPLGVLKHNDIKFIPQLPTSLTQAIESGAVGNTGKVYFEFDEVFWPADVDKILFAGEPIPVVISNWYKYNGEKKHPGLYLITPPPLTAKLEQDHTLAFDALKPVLEALRTDKSKPVPTPTKVTTSKWSVDPYSRGSYATYTVGYDLDKAVGAFETGAGHVRFAGEHTILRGASFTHGAYRSGLREAAFILKQLKSRL
ncbi:polyamine oxidase [Sugiyamaella lignohabitans]|uniref:Amine oxidase n=1 Tax=Sugiyamaella lignohabitans TaxID=796027 RepID=A0A167C8N9_9ASCO|nr:polyamine oxidase [Sugiyamaella lignohabitans]ANB11362.1 polyamine oxidase [Sugiyamaella lignohabitans]